MLSDREKKTPKGIMSLFRETLTGFYGLTPDTVEYLLRQLTARGEVPEMKKHVQTMNATIYNRMNTILDLLGSDAHKTDEEPAEDGDSEGNAAPEGDSTTNTDTPVKESTLLRSINSSINEENDANNSTTVNDMSKEDMIRLARMNPQRKELELKKRRRKERMDTRRAQGDKNIDPKVKQLMRQQEILKQRLEKVQVELSAAKSNQQQQQQPEQPGQ